ncbi:unnamed protein product [Microthlaspi erraticum]|uniref:Uncharacterized protein n=1 Tax=Microthlaspi erraticum TaxID=1685480 RepID=A0A6D2IAY9_9BRAS|nr:unnamed protein product [Microthlaspi erraticum]
MHIPPGFSHQPPRPAANQEPKLRAMLKQLLQGQADGVMETRKKLADLNSKIESLNTRVHTLENHTSSAAAKQGQLPGKPVQNPKEHCKVIFTREEEFDQQAANEKAIEEICMLLNDEDNVVADAPEVQYFQHEVQATQIAIHTSPVELAQQVRSAARSSPTSATRSSQTVSVPQPVLLEPYQPVDPSSGRLLSQGQKEVIHKFRRDLSEIGVELPSMGSMNEAFEQMKLIQDVMDNKDKVSKLLELSTAQHNLLTSPIFLPKLEDQGKFTLPYKLGHLEFDDALVDSGASVNLISLAMAQKLSIHGALQRSSSTIMFADAISKSPLGVFKNYPLKVGECPLPTDLTVLEMEEEKDVPLILGTPFLSTVVIYPYLSCFYQGFHYVFNTNNVVFMPKR